MKKNKTIISIFDTEISPDALDKAIQTQPDLAILKHLGEIRIDIEDAYSLGKEDNRFDAHNEKGNLSTYGGMTVVVKDLKIEWEPSLEDVKCAIEGDFDNSVVNGKEFKSKDIALEDRKSTQFIKNVVQTHKIFDITSLIKPERIEEIEKYILDKLVD
jgi:hypothetical protein